MHHAIYLDPQMVPETLRGGYGGRQFKAVVCERMQPMNMQWSGGTRYTYVARDLASGIGRAITDNRPFPENQSAVPAIDIPAGWCIVEHSVFCGKDTGLTFYVRPENAASLLPMPGSAMSEQSMAVLAIIAGLISKARQEYARRAGISREEWDAITTELKASGHLTKNGGITPKGRNAVTREAIRKYT